ncbi:MAG: 5-formyltetrahydrofolate cyclo-ligase [Fibrobacterota bacterium]
MLNGIGFSETALTVLFVLIFFGSESLPKILKDLGRFYSRLRKYYLEIRNTIMSEYDKKENKPAKENAHSTLKNAKQRIRMEILKKRNSIRPDRILQYSREISSSILALSEYSKAEVVYIYLSKDSEVVSDFIIEKSLSDGKIISVPKCRPPYSMEFYPVKNCFTDTKTGYMGIREPHNIKQGPCVYPPDIIIIPGIAYDYKRNRIGYGKGYFDRYLDRIKANASSLIIAPAFDEQIYPYELPCDEKDRKPDIIITPSQVIGGKIET